MSAQASGVGGDGPTRYELYGLQVDSDIVVAGAPTGRSDRPADVRIRLREPVSIPHRIPDGQPLALSGVPEHFHHTVVRTGESSLTFRVPGIVDFELHGTSPLQVEVLPASMDQLGLIEIFAAGALFAVHFEATGVPILHASAVAVDESAVAIVGHSGRGKSTTSALLCRAGHQLVTDDLLRLWLRADGITCARGTTSLRLREKARPLAEAHGSRITSADGRLLLEPRTSAASVLPLRALVFPFPTRDEGAQVTARGLRVSEVFDELLAPHHGSSGGRTRRS